MAGAGRITLRVYREDENVCISIRDNGKGISAETIEQLLSGSFNHIEDSYDNNGIGMDNVISRVRIFAERDDAIEIISLGENKGCEVIIRLPMEVENV
jgi:LytS/YehU family sensor histidine kinase